MLKRLTVLGAVVCGGAWLTLACSGETNQGGSGGAATNGGVTNPGAGGATFGGTSSTSGGTSSTSGGTVPATFGGTTSTTTGGTTSTTGGTTATGSGGGSTTTDKFSFFVTSLGAMQELSGNPKGFGGDLRYGGATTGLEGADKICAAIAEKSMKGAGAKGWRAFLSTVKGGANDGPIHAIDRIGEGPWYDRNGLLVAMTKADLLFDRPKGGPWCGHSWPRQGSRVNWMSALAEGGCAPGINLEETGGPEPGVYTVGTGGGYGGIYCFALKP